MVCRGVYDVAFGGITHKSLSFDRFPTYVGEAIDKDGPTDAEVPASRVGDDA